MLRSSVRALQGEAASIDSAQGLSELGHLTVGFPTFVLGWREEALTFEINP